LERLGLEAVFEFDPSHGISGAKRAEVAMRALERGVDKVGSGVGKMGEGFRQATTALAPALLAVGAATAFAVKNFVDFNSEFAKIGTLLDGGTREARGFTRDVERLALQFGKGTKDIQAAMFQTLSAGGSAAKHPIEVLKAAGMAATAGFTTIETAADGLTNVLNAYGMNVSEVGRINDAFFIANREGKTTVDELAKSIGQAAPTAALVGVPLEELTSAIALMTTQGIDTQMSVVSINQALLSFVKPSREAAKLAEQYGIDLSLSALKAKGFRQALADVNDKIGDNEDALAMLFGNVRAFRAAASLAAEGGAAFSRVLEATRTETGITAEKFRDVTGDIGFQFKRLLPAAGIAANRIGKAFAEVFNLAEASGGADWIEANLDRIEQKAKAFFASVKRGFNELRIGEKIEAARAAFERLGRSIDATFGSESGRRVADMALAIGAIGIVAAPLLFALSPIVGMIGGIGKAALGLGEALGGIATTVSGLGASILGVADASAILAGAVGGAAVVGAVAVGAAAVEAYQDKSTGLSLAIDNLWGSIKNLWTVIAESAAFISAQAPGAWQGFVNVIGEVARGAVHLLTIGIELLGVALKGVGLVIAGIVWFLDEIAQSISAVIREVRDAYYAVGTMTGLWEDNRAAVEHYNREVERTVAAAETHRQQVEIDARAYQSLAAATEAAANAENALARAKDSRRASEAGYGDALTDEILSDIAGAKKSEIVATSNAVANATSKQKIEVTANLKVDGQTMNAATGRAQVELSERAGANVTPWQRRTMIERGAQAATAG